MAREKCSEEKTEQTVQREQTETGLPPWVYVDDDFLALEREKLFRPSWQIICHESDIADTGAYATLNFCGVLVLVVRGDDGKARAFKNICRHRAARLLDGSFGQCKSRITCPYHAWTYDLKGALVGVPQRDGYDAFDNQDYGLIPLELRSCGGFLFAALNDNAPSFDDFIAPMKPVFETYQTSKMQALGRISLRTRAVNWKIAVENYVDAMHLPIAHKGLDDLVGDSYTLENDNGAYHISAELRDAPNQSLSAQAYRHFLPDVPHLPEKRQRSWSYKMLWPNLAFDIYPDQIDFMQFIPLAPDCTLLREISYALPDERREMRAARYLNWRVNRVINVEDKDVIERVQAGLQSGDYQPGPISQSEICLRDFTRRMREALPICSERVRPSSETLRKQAD